MKRFVSGLLAPILILIILWPTWAYSLDPKFGPEFTFSSQRAWDSPLVLHGALENIVLELNKKYPRAGHKLTQVSDPKNNSERMAFLFEYPDGFWIRFTIDEGAVEVQTKPQTRSEWQKREEQIQADIFDIAAKAGLQPAIGLGEHRNGGGHISIGADIFDANPMLFSRFLADYANHPERMWIFQGTPEFSPNLRLLELDRQREFWHIVSDPANARGRPAHAIASLIQKHVYRDTPYNHGQPTKHQELNLTRMTYDPDPVTGKPVPAGQRRVEVRSIGAQRSAREFLVQVNFLYHDLERLEKSTDPIVRKRVAELTEKSAREIFQTNIAELEISWSAYKKFLPTQISSRYQDIFAHINHGKDESPAWCSLKVRQIWIGPQGSD